MFGTLTYQGTIGIGDKARPVSIEINAYHIHIYDTRTYKELWKRTPDMPEWLDEIHTDFTKGIRAIEKVLEYLSK